MGEEFQAGPRFQTLKGQANRRSSDVVFISSRSKTVGLDSVEKVFEIVEAKTVDFHKLIVITNKEIISHFIYRIESSNRMLYKGVSVKNTMFIIFVLGLIPVQVMAFSSIKSTCVSADGGRANLVLNGPREQTSSWSECREWDEKDNCVINPYTGDDLACDCLVSEKRTVNYLVWDVQGKIDIADSSIPINATLNQVSASQRNGGTQSGSFGELQYVANFLSEADPSRNLRIILSRWQNGKVGRTVISNLICAFK